MWSIVSRYVARSFGFFGGLRDDARGKCGNGPGDHRPDRFSNAIHPNVEILGISKPTRYCSPIEMNHRRNKIHFTLNQYACREAIRPLVSKCAVAPIQSCL